MIIFSLGFTFSLASVPGEETGIDSLKRHGSRGSLFGQVYTGNHGLGLRQFLLIWIEFISIRFPNDILWS